MIVSVTEKFSKSYLSTSVFVSRAYKAVEQISKTDFFMRPRGCKEVIEEIIPIAAFLKHFEIPGRSVKCKYYGGNHNYDAKIRIDGSFVEQGYFEANYFLEVTTAISKNEHLAREELALTGFTFGDGDIRSEGSKQKGTYKVLSHAAAENHDAPVTKASKLITECLVKKAKKQYPNPCILLVQVEPERPPTIHEWSTIVKSIRDSVDREAFALTFIVNAWRNTVIQI
ncbi:MAG: hypothetical protein IPI64_12965 [Chloracidobacterium sp.]|nr:hypothetical protein [Chloracidobacterium sp.]